LATELTADQSQALFNVLEVCKLSKNQVLISEGDFDDHLYALARGELEVSREGARGQEVLGRLGPGSIVGELAFLDGLKRTATVKAVNDDCCVFVMHRHQLESLLSTDPSLVYRVMRTIVRSAHRTVDKMDTTYTNLMHYISG
jgi:CRP-like cAMP-binding protein